MDHASYIPPVYGAVATPKAHSGPFPPAIAAAVRSALDRILRSPDFPASKRNRKFLRYVVEAELEGRGGEVNGFVIGSQVFGRGKSFDHVKDPIVRIEASKLRRDLERYHLTAGRRERIVITMPKGSYRPAFEAREEEDLPDGPVAQPVLDPAGLTLASLHGGDGSFGHMQPPLRAQLADGLARIEGISVYVAAEPDVALLDSEAVRRAARCNKTALVLSGDFWTDAGKDHMVVRLHDGDTGRLLWSEEFAQDGAGVLPQVVRRVDEARRRLASPHGNGVVG